MGRDDQGRSEVVVDDEVAPGVRLMFERYATGFVSLKQLARELADRGLRSHTGRLVAPSYLRTMLENPFYVGRLRWNGRDFQGRHSPLIAEDLFVRVQGVLRARHKNSGDKGKLRFMLRGVAYCAECGARMTAERHIVRQKSYYRCVRHTVSRNLCGAPLSNVDVTHAEVASLLGRLRLEPALEAAIIAEGERFSQKRVEGAREQANSIRMRLVRLSERELRIGDAFSRGDMSADVYRELATRLRSERVGMQASLDDADVDPHAAQQKIQNVLTAVRSVRDAYRGLDDERRHRLFRLLFTRIQLRKGAVVEYSLRAPFDRLLRDTGDGSTLSDFVEVMPARKNVLELNKAIEAILTLDDRHLREVMEKKPSDDRKAA
jgi:site-specific DNA recombinase